MSKNPLNETFNMDEDPFSDEEYSITIPENPELSDIIQLALKAFKEQMEDAHFIDPKFKARNLEVSHQFLKLAQESLVKKVELSQSDKKLSIEEAKVRGKFASDEDEEEVSPTVTRKELLEELSKDE